MLEWRVRYTPWTAARHGERDGLKGIPHWDDAQQPPYVMRLKQAGDQSVRSVSTAWAAADERLKTAWQQARESVQTAQQEAKAAQERLQAVSAEYENRQGRKPEHEAPGRRGLHAVFLAGLFLAEFPLNVMVFRLFGEAEVLTYIVTGALALGLLGGAHLLGSLLKEGSFQDKVRVALAVLLSAIGLAVMIATACLREAYLAQMAEAQHLTSLSSRATTFAFVIINLLIFVVATVTSYFAHNPLLRSVERVRQAAQQAQRRLQQAEHRLSQARTQREKIFLQYQVRAHQRKDTVQELVETYREHNLQARSIEEERSKSSLQPPPFRPQSFERYPDVTIPDNLQQLEWEDGEGGVRAPEKEEPAGSAAPEQEGFPRGE